MKTLLSALAALMLIGAVTATPAQAACWFNGYTWVCGGHYWHHGDRYYRHYHHGWHSNHYYRHYH